MFKFIMKKEKKPKGFLIYFTKKELDNAKIRNVLLQLVETKLQTQFIGKKYVIVGEAEYEVIKRSSSSSVVDYKLYKRRGVKKLRIDGAVEVGKYKGRRILMKK